MEANNNTKEPIEEKAFPVLDSFKRYSHRSANELSYAIYEAEILNEGKYELKVRDMRVTNLWVKLDQVLGPCYTIGMSNEEILTIKKALLEIIVSLTMLYMAYEDITREENDWLAELNHHIEIDKRYHLEEEYHNLNISFGFITNEEVMMFLSDVHTDMLKSVKLDLDCSTEAAVVVGWVGNTYNLAFLCV